MSDEGSEVVNAELVQLAEPQTAEQKVTWLELLFDLIFVVAFDQLAKRLGDSVTSWTNVSAFLLMFLAVWWAWLGNATFAARYGNESRVYRWGTLVELLAMGVLALTLRGDLQDTGGAFAVAYGSSRLLHAALHFWALREHPATRRLSGGLALINLLTAGLWLCSAWLEGGSLAQIALWCLAWFSQLGWSVYWREESREVLPHTAHLTERLGLLQIIALGAVVNEIVAGSRQQALRWSQLLAALGGMIVALGLWRLYFDQARSLPLLIVQWGGRMSALYSWLYSHLPLTLALIILGVGLGHGLSSAEAASAALYQRFVAWSLAASLLLLAFLRWQALRLLRAWRWDRSLSALGLAAVLSLSLSFLDLDTLQTHLLAALITALTALVVATDPQTERLGRIEQGLQEQAESLAGGGSGERRL